MKKQDLIKRLNEKLNTQQKSVPQLPADAEPKHISVLNNKTDPKHPFSGYMVGTSESVEQGTDPYKDGYNAWKSYLSGETSRYPSNPYPAGRGMHKWELGAAHAAEGHDFGQDSEEDVAEGSETSLKAATVAAWNAVVKKHPDWISQYGANAVKRATKEIVRRHYENMDQGNIDGILFHIEGELAELDESIAEDWQKTNKKDKTDGMSKKAVNAYRRENPGSKLQTAVTTKPSKLKPGSKSAKRRKSFCARMSGMKKAHASAKTKRDPNSPINKALRRWNCESKEQLKDLLEARIAEIKQRLDAKCWKGKHKEGTKIKGGVRVNNCVPNESMFNESWAEIDQHIKEEWNYNNSVVNESSDPAAWPFDNASSVAEADLSVAGNPGTTPKVGEWIKGKYNTPYEGKLGQIKQIDPNRNVMRMGAEAEVWWKSVARTEWVPLKWLAKIGGTKFAECVAEGAEDFSITQYKDKSYPGSIEVVVTNKKTGHWVVFGGHPRQIAKDIKRRFGIDYNFNQKGVAEGGSFSYGAKKPRKGSVRDLADKKRKEQEKKNPPIEPRDQMVGVAKVTKGVAEGERNEMDTPEFQQALLALKKQAAKGPTKAVLNPKTGKYIFVPVDQLKKKVSEDIANEDVLSALKAKLGDLLLQTLGKEVSDTDLKDKTNSKDDKEVIPVVKKITTDDGHEICIHGNEDDGFRISVQNKEAPSKFKTLDEAVMACEMYCAHRRNNKSNADYIEEA